jgi:cytoskeletal protein RodZ
MQGALDRPRFRQDLVAELVEDGKTRFIDVADPDNGQVFRFYEIEYSLACAMDGERDLAGIVRWAKEELGLTANPNDVKTVISTLGDLGYLETAAAAAAAAKPIEKPAAAAAGVKAGRKPTPPAMNRWDSPTAMGDSDQYLEKGVHAAKSAAHAPVDDVELGRAGAKVAVSDMPKAPELELGAPGATRGAQPKAIPTSEIPLGSSGRAPDVSVDLSDGMAVKPDDVKEAVRASQVMRAPSVPQELLDAVAPTMIDKPSEAKKPVEAKKPEARPQPRGSIESPAPRPAPEPIRPKTPSKAPPAPSSGVSPVLLILLVIVVVAAGAFVAYKFILKKSDETASTQPPPPVTPPKPPEPPPPPPVESEKLASEQPAEQELKAPAAGTLETVAANDAMVKAGDVVFALAGHKPIETAMAAVSKDIDKRLQPDVTKAEHDRDAAEQAGNKPGVTSAEKRIETAKKALDDAQRKVATMTTDLDKLVVKASADGKVTAVAKANAKVTPNDVVAKLAPGAMLVATFKKTDPAVAADARVLLAVKGSEQKLSCKVVDASNGTKIACPHDAAPEGSEVTFAGVDNSPPPEAPKPDEGSAAKVAPPPPEAPRPPPARPIRPPNRPVAPKPPEKPTDKPADPPPGGEQPAPAPAGSAAP